MRKPSPNVSISCVEAIAAVKALGLARALQLLEAYD